MDLETYKAILEAEKEAQATKETNAKEVARKKDESAKKKVAAEVKKIIIVANKVVRAAEEAATKKNLKNNRKSKKGSHLRDVENPEETIQQLFLESNNKAVIIKEDVINQLNTKLQAATNKASRSNYRF